MKDKIIVFSIIFFVLLFPIKVTAESTYVLPYPSAMPGNKFYYLDQVAEFLGSYWYFGDFGRFTFHLSQADKYLVESKTLFEYKQYKLAIEALKKSDKYFSQIETDLSHAKKNNKDVTEKKVLLQNAKEKHREVLEDIKKEIPQDFIWLEESGHSENLKMHTIINNALSIRK